MCIYYRNCNMKKTILSLLTCLLFIQPCMLTSCTESDGEQNEFENWEERNSGYFYDVYSEAQSKIADGSDEWMILRKWSLEETAATRPEDNIVVNIREKGEGTASPLYTDTVMVNIRGRLIPSVSYSGGYVFISSYDGDMIPELCKPAAFPADGTAPEGMTSAQLDGLATAFQYMHVGDRWTVFVPYGLGYGTQGSSNPLVPGYSTLIYDVMLMGY